MAFRWPVLIGDYPSDIPNLGALSIIMYLNIKTLQSTVAVRRTHVTFMNAWVVYTAVLQPSIENRKLSSLLLVVPIRNLRKLLRNSSN